MPFILTGRWVVATIFVRTVYTTKPGGGTVRTSKYSSRDRQRISDVERKVLSAIAKNSDSDKSEFTVVVSFNQREVSMGLPREVTTLLQANNNVKSAAFTEKGKDQHIVVNM